MAAKRHERTRARRAALQVLYAGEITEAAPADIAKGEGLIDEVNHLSDYAVALIEGVGAHRESIDEQLNEASENWSLLRMPIVDRSILRLAAYEMVYVDDVPLSVSINEAVELAKDFGGEDDSPRFVNGVLGRIAKQVSAETGEPVEDLVGGEGAAAPEAPVAAEVPVVEDAPETETADALKEAEPHA